MGGNSHLEKFKIKHLKPGERIAAWAEGYIGDFMGSGDNTQHNGALIVTSDRVAFYRDGIFGNVIESISLPAVTSVERRTMLGFQTITLHASPNSLRFKCFNETQASGVVAAIDAIKNKQKEGATSSDNQSDAPLAQLERLARLHAAGALTQAEFNDQKRRLIGPSDALDGSSSVQIKGLPSSPDSKFRETSLPEGSAAMKTCKKCGSQSNVENLTPASACHKCGAIFAKLDLIDSHDAPLVSLQKNSTLNAKPRNVRGADPNPSRSFVVTILSGFFIFLLLVGALVYFASNPKNYEEEKAGLIVSDNRPVVNIPAAISTFEISSFVGQYKLDRPRSIVQLQSDGTEYSYGFADPDGGMNSITVGLLIAESGRQSHISFLIHGNSISSPGRLTPSRQEMIRQLYRSTLPEVQFDQVLQIILSEQMKVYDGGSKQMPVRSVGSGSLRVGVTGSTLVIVFNQ